jgi:hypothetical protein
MNVIGREIRDPSSLLIQKIPVHFLRTLATLSKVFMDGSDVPVS